MITRPLSSLLFALLAVLPVGTVHAEWQELLKDEQMSYYFDKDSVMPIHVSRYAWTLIDRAQGDKAPNGETYKSAMVRWRMYCKTDMVVPLSVSFYDQAMGKGKEVDRDDAQEWRIRETPIRPNTYLAALKKEICASRQAAAS